MFRVAVVDDDPDMRLLIRFALEDAEEFELVGEAADARAGVDLILDTDPDVVILDRDLPFFSGDEVLRRIRGHGSTAKVVIHSGNTDPPLPEGADAFVVKDGHVDTLLHTLAAVVGRG